jgi:tetratricopeptide (TPR) repeat protein
MADAGVDAPSTVVEALAQPVGRDSVPPFLELAGQLRGYEILGELGRGGMGVVYRARDSRGRVVALKTLQGMDPSALYRFKLEFRALADLAHPNLVSLHELVSDGRQWFFAMELVEGVDFLKHVRAGGPGAERPRLRAALRQLAAGLSALHAAGILHRDVKPSNVLVEAHGRVVLLDFGLAAELDPGGRHQSSAHHLLGTVAYMAPEQAAALALSPAVDWYSVGVMLYEAFAGRLPFAGTFFQVLHDKQERDPPSLRELAPDAPEDLADLCMALLRRDPRTRPTGQEVLLRLGGGPQAGGDLSSRPTGRRAPLIGRSRELEALWDAFREVTQGQTVVVSVQGLSGVGKSALVQHFLDEAAQEVGAVVLAGRCYEQESVPYKALDSLIDALSRYLGQLSTADTQALLPRDAAFLARVFPVLRCVEVVAGAPGHGAESADPHEARRRAGAALRELLGRLGDRRPLILFIDDLHWGDLDGAALLADLLRPPDPPVLLLVGAYRSEDAAGSPFLNAFFGRQSGVGAAPDRRDLVVTPLPPSEARDLALGLLGRADSDTRALAEEIARESGGSPFFVYELVQHLQSGGPAAAVRGDVALERVLWGRILRLPEEARRLLEVVAVAGRPLPRESAWRAATVPEGDAALAHLRSGRLVRARGDEIDAYHDRIREAVLVHLGPPGLADCHRRLAEALEAEGGADPEVLAVHFHGSGLSEPAGRYYAAAADQATEILAFDHAARLYRLALQQGRPTGPDEQSLRARLGDALANAGRGAEAAREYLLAAAGASKAKVLDLQRRAAQQLLLSGHVDEGIKTLRPALDAVGMRLAATPTRALLSLLCSRLWLWLRGVRFRERTPEQVHPEVLKRIDVCWSVATGCVFIDPIRAAAFGTRSLLLALRAGEPKRIARALAQEAGHISSAGWWAKNRAVKLHTVAFDLARRLDDPQALGMATFIAGAMAYLEGSWKAGLEHCDRAERIFRDRCIGVAWELGSTRTFALWCLNYLGEMAELSRRWHQFVQEASERGDLYLLTNLRTANMAVMRLAADDPERAGREVEEAISQWSQSGYHVQHHNALFGRIHIALYTGNAVGALEQVTNCWPLFRKSLLGSIQTLRIHMRQFRSSSALAVAVGAADPKPLLRLAQLDARRMKGERLSWTDAHCQYIRAAVTFLRGDSVMGRKHLAKAAAAFEAADMRLYAAACRRRLGRLVGGAEGQVLVEQADAWMAGQDIRNPARMTAVFAPGFPD